MRMLNPTTLNALLRSDREIAVLDVREAGAFARKHLLHAVSAPLWRMPLIVDRLVPRRDTCIVVTDLDGSSTRDAESLLARLGYTDVSALDGGTLAWEAAGLEVFSGDGAWSKAFGEMVELATGTPHIDVDTLVAMTERKEKFIVVDGRTPEEFQEFCLPGALSVPNGELAYRVRDLAPDADTTIVVNCAGRTRSIMGAQTLIDSGLPNRVVALENGTMAWLLAGKALVHGQRCTGLAEPTPGRLAATRESVGALSRRLGLRTLGVDELADWSAAPDRTLYRFDVRTAVEYRSGHLPGWRWAPGGQLLQATDQFFATRGARIVLADWDGVRAPMIAAWLARMGLCEVGLFVPPAHGPLEVGDETWHVLQDSAAPAVQSLSADELQALQGSDEAIVFDVDRSLQYRNRHIAGALFACPDRVAEFARRLAAGRRVVITSSNGVLARSVASRLTMVGAEASALGGGNAAWFAAGLPTDTGTTGILTGEDDVWYSPYAYDDRSVRDAKFREYLDWELGLPAQLDRDGAQPRFRLAAG